jgi:hypothetical protein
MNLKNLREIDKDELLNMIGLQTKRSPGDWLVSSLAIFGVGVLVGAGVGLLLAPKPGRELREDLRSRLQGAAGSLEDSFATEPGSTAERPRAY